jgi:hypothetical protein
MRDQQALKLLFRENYGDLLDEIAAELDGDVYRASRALAAGFTRLCELRTSFETADTAVVFLRSAAREAAVRDRSTRGADRWYALHSTASSSAEGYG